MQPVLSINELSVQFSGPDGFINAVDAVSFDVAEGEIVGLVGESGSGKSMTGLALLGLVDVPGSRITGSARLQGIELIGQKDASLRKLRGKSYAMIFQDPMTTLNPVLRIGTQIIETIKAHERVSHAAAYARAIEALEKVGIPSPKERLSNYPHQFSGGMRQRIAIAIALLHSPKLLIADEPTTALDVTIQAQILSEVRQLSSEFGTAIIWISHDLSTVSGLADRIAVMYSGRIVEIGSARQIIETPRHPYTVGLIHSVPSRNRRGAPLRYIPGRAPSPFARPMGCAFHPRCASATDLCEIRPPVTTENGRAYSCHHPKGPQNEVNRDALAFETLQKERT